MVTSGMEPLDCELDPGVGNAAVRKRADHLVIAGDPEMVEEGVELVESTRLLGRERGCDPHSESLGVRGADPVDRPLPGTVAAVAVVLLGGCGVEADLQGEPGTVHLA